MTQHVSDIMTSAPVTVEPQTSVTAVARLMRDQDLGAVLVTDGDELRGLVTDRDLVVRALAEGGDPEQTTVVSACSEDLVTVGPEDDLDHAITLMREHAVRRIPVVEEATPSASSPSATPPWNATRSRPSATSAWPAPTPERGKGVRPRRQAAGRRLTDERVCGARALTVGRVRLAVQAPGTRRSSMEGR